MQYLICGILYIMGICAALVWFIEWYKLEFPIAYGRVNRIDYLLVALLAMVFPITWPHFKFEMMLRIKRRDRRLFD
jgi:hypothetical protein